MIEFPIYALVFLISSGLMAGISCSIQRMGKIQAETIAKNQKGLAKWLFRKQTRDYLSYTLSITKNISLISFTITAFDFATTLHPTTLTVKEFAISGLVILGISTFFDSLFRILSLRWPTGFFRITCQISTLFIFLYWPLSIFLFKILKSTLRTSKEFTPFRMKDKILEILHDSEFAPYIDPHDQKLLLSVISFKERIAREVMVPRIDMYTLSADTPIQQAAESFLQQGYSRIPIWKDTVDHIIGTLYYKDLLNLYFVSERDPKILSQPVEKLIKPIVYTPETKKISQLLQEFRSKQILLAIVVDEYGGTEGIVTIEDILEELVGEIADEYDHDEEALYTVLPSGGWIVDAKMTIIEIENVLGIKIPQNPEYDTIGGFIFHKAGAIPTKGWSLHHDDFDLEVLSSSERTLGKIRITAH